MQVAGPVESKVPIAFASPPRHNDYDNGIFASRCSPAGVVADADVGVSILPPAYSLTLTRADIDRPDRHQGPSGRDRHP